MSGIVLQATAFKVSNKNGGLFHVPGTKVKDDGDKHHLFTAKDSGSDYVHFYCPKCNHRNKQSMYEHAGYVPSDNSAIPFKCRMCRTAVEVFPPRAPLSQESLIVSPEQFTREMAQRRQDLSQRRIVSG